MCMRFPSIGNHFLADPIIRLKIYWALNRDPSIYENYHMAIWHVGSVGFRDQGFRVQACPKLRFFVGRPLNTDDEMLVSISRTPNPKPQIVNPKP